MTSKASFVLVIIQLLVSYYLPSNAVESPAEIYWKTKVGNIPMPKTLKDSLQLDPTNSEDHMLHANPANPEDFAVVYANPTNPEDFIPVYANPTNPEDFIPVYANPTNTEDFIPVYANPTNPEDFIPVYANPTNSKDHFGYKYQTNAEYWLWYNNRTNSEDHFEYKYPTNSNQITKSQIPQDVLDFFFTSDTLFRVGAKKKLRFNKIINETKFLPLHVAKSMPTTSDKLQVILNQLSVNPKSISARAIEMTMKICEEKGVKDEKRYCATSLEGMVDYVTSILNSRETKLMAVSTEQDDGIYVEYTIRKVQKLGSDGNHNLVCHKLSNPYVVFLCHNIKSTNLYNFYLVGANGKQTKAVAVCHKDTSSWNPSHYAFKLLNSKPGGKPICHFVTANAIVWFRT